MWENLFPGTFKKHSFWPHWLLEHSSSHLNTWTRTLDAILYVKIGILIQSPKTFSYVRKVKVSNALIFKLLFHSVKYHRTNLKWKGYLVPKFTFSFWKFWSLTGQQPSERSEQFGLGCRDSLVDLSVPSILHPQVRLPAHHLCFHQFIKLSNVEKTKINKKRPGLALFKNMWWNVFTYLASLATALMQIYLLPNYIIHFSISLSVYLSFFRLLAYLFTHPVVCISQAISLSHTHMKCPYHSHQVSCFIRKVRLTYQHNISYTST